MAFRNEIRTASVAVPAMLLGGTATVQATWSEAFRDNNYRATGLLVDSTGLLTVNLQSCTAKTPTSCSLVLKAPLVAIASGKCTLDVILIHD